MKVITVGIERRGWLQDVILMTELIIHQIMWKTLPPSLSAPENVKSSCFGRLLRNTEQTQIMDQANLENNYT